MLWGLYPPPCNPYGLQWTPVDSSGLHGIPVALLPGQIGWCNVQSSPVQSTGLTLDCKPLFRVQSQSSGLWVQSESSGVQWSPVESSVVLIIKYKYYKKSEIRRLTCRALVATSLPPHPSSMPTRKQVGWRPRGVPIPRTWQGNGEWWVATPSVRSHYANTFPFYLLSTYDRLRFTCTITIYITSVM